MRFAKLEILKTINIKSINFTNLKEIVLENITHLKTQKSLIDDYDLYYLSYKDLIEHSLKALGFTFLVSVSFYNSMILFAMLIPICVIYPFFLKKILIKKRKNELIHEFKDFLRTLQSFLDASYSLESSFPLCIKEMSMLYGEDSMMVNELKDMCKKINMNKPIELVFREFALKTKVDDILDFSDVLMITKRMGGNINKAIKNTISLVNDKFDIEIKIKTLTAQKQFEQSIMNLLPFFIIIYMNFSSRDYLKVLYTSIWGRLLMTILLLFYFLSIRISKKIIDIEV